MSEVTLPAARPMDRTYRIAAQGPQFKIPKMPVDANRRMKSQRSVALSLQNRDRTRRPAAVPRLIQLKSLPSREKGPDLPPPARAPDFHPERPRWPRQPSGATASPIPLLSKLEGRPKSPTHASPHGAPQKPARLQFAAILPPTSTPPTMLRLTKRPRPITHPALPVTSTAAPGPQEDRGPPIGLARSRILLRTADPVHSQTWAAFNGTPSERRSSLSEKPRTPHRAIAPVGTSAPAREATAEQMTDIRFADRSVSSFPNETGCLLEDNDATEVYLDGHALGQWILEHLERTLTRAPTTANFVTNHGIPAWPGQPPLF